MVALGVTSRWPTVPTCAAGPRGHRLAHGQRQLRGRNQRILPVRHHRRARVVGEAGDGRVIASIETMPSTTPIGDAVALERAALFDVQLEIA